MRCPEAAALPLKKLLTQHKVQQGWGWGAVLAGGQLWPGCGFSSLSVPVGAWCPHKDSPMQPVPRCVCHSPFLWGGVDLPQADMHQWAMSLCFAKCCSMWPGSSAQKHREQGLGSAAAPLVSARDSCLAPRCTGPAPNPGWICAALAHRQWKSYNWSPHLKVTFF